MQTFITDINFNKSAQNLDRARLGASIYESIHILASLLKVNENLITPKRDVSNHPASKLWIGWEGCLLNYIRIHIGEWRNRGYKSKINFNNYRMLCYEIPYEYIKKAEGYTIPDWVTKKVIDTHRNCLYRKRPDFYPIEWRGDMEMQYSWRKE